MSESATQHRHRISARHRGERSADDVPVALSAARNVLVGGHGSGKTALCVLAVDRAGGDCVVVADNSWPRSIRPERIFFVPDECDDEILCSVIVAATTAASRRGLPLVLDLSNHVSSIGEMSLEALDGSWFSRDIPSVMVTFNSFEDAPPSLWRNTSAQKALLMHDGTANYRRFGTIAVSCADGSMTVSDIPVVERFLHRMG